MVAFHLKEVIAALHSEGGKRKAGNYVGVT